MTTPAPWRSGISPSVHGAWMDGWHRNAPVLRSQTSCNDSIHSRQGVVRHIVAKSASDRMSTQVHLRAGKPLEDVTERTSGAGRGRIELGITQEGGVSRPTVLMRRNGSRRRFPTPRGGCGPARGGNAASWTRRAPGDRRGRDLEQVGEAMPSPGDTTLEGTLPGKDTAHLAVGPRCGWRSRPKRLP